MSLLFTVGGVFLFGLAGWNMDAWTEDQRASDMIVVFIDAGLGLWWMLMGTRHD